MCIRDSHNVYVLAGCQNVIQTAEADIVCPAVAAEDPNGLLSEVFLVSQNILAVRAACCCALFELCNQCLCRLSVENGCLRVVDSYPNGKTDAVNALYLPDVYKRQVLRPGSSP